MWLVGVTNGELSTYGLVSGNGEVSPAPGHEGVSTYGSVSGITTALVVA